MWSIKKYAPNKYESCLYGVAEVLAGIFGSGPEFLLDAEDLVVFGETLRATRGASFDLSGGETHYQVGDEGVLSLARPVGDHGTPSVLFGQQVCGDRLSDTSDLVHL